MNKLSIRLKELREEKGLTQSELAKALNYTQTTIARWEAGNRSPNLDCLTALAKFFDCTTDYLLGLTDY